MQSRKKDLVFLDIHNHIMFGLDDGAENIRETRKMLEMAYEDGIRAIIATPHYRPERWAVSPEQTEWVFQKVQRLAKRIDSTFQIYPGNEIFYRDETAELLAKGKIRTLAKSRYLLVEFHPDAPYEYMRQGLQTLCLAGYQVILAHWERYDCLKEEPDRLEGLAQGGVLIQSNVVAILGKQGRAVKKMLREMIQDGFVDFVATDSHDLRKRPPQLSPAYDYIRKKIGEETAYQLCVENPRSVIENQLIKRKRR